MKSFVKLPKVLLTATLFRGRNRLSRLVVLAILMGIMYAGFWLSQQKQHTRERIAIAPGDEEIMKNIKERHVNDDLGIPNPNLLSIKDDGNIANMIMSEKHQDTGESKDKDYREKANVEEQQIGDKNADSAIDSMGQVEKEYPNDVDQMGNIQGEYMDDKEQYKNDNYPEQIDRNVVQDGEEKRVGDYGEQGREDEGYQDGDKDGGMEPGDREDFSKEMAKLDVMEEKRNHLVLSENEEASPDKDTAEGQEEAGEEGPGPAGEDGGVKENEKEGVDPPVGGVESNERAEGGDVEEEEAVGADHDMKIGGVDDTNEDGEGGGAVKEAEREADLEEQRRMTAEEVAAAIRSGEMCKSVCPPFVWSEWSPCSKACGRGRRYRKAIYEFVCQSSDLCPLNRIEESICETPCKFDPDKYGGPNGLDLYPINPLNPAIFPEERDYMCGHWLVEYEKIHKEILDGKRAPAYLVYSTGKGEYPTAGGLSGRIKGITTVFFMAVLLERAFLIEWQDPNRLENYLVPKSFNWADLTPLQHLKRGKAHDIGSWKAAKESGKSSQWYMDEDFGAYFKKPVEVIQGPRYDYTYAILRNPSLMPKAYELGIDRVKCHVCCAWDMLFKTAPKFEEEMNKLMRSLGHPVRPVVAVQARVKSDDVQKSVTDVEHYLNCAQKATKELKLKTPIYIPILNNRLVVHILQKKYFRIMKTPIEIETATRTVHTHLGNLPSDTEEEVILGVQERTFEEFFVMLNSTLLVRAKGYLGSFGNVADAIRRHYGKPGTVHTYTSGGSSCALFPDGSKIE